MSKISRTDGSGASYVIMDTTQNLCPAWIAWYKSESTDLAAVVRDSQHGTFAIESKSINAYSVEIEGTLVEIQE